MQLVVVGSLGSTENVLLELFVLDTTGVVGVDHFEEGVDELALN